MLHNLTTTELTIFMLDKLENANTEAPHTNAAWQEEQLLVKLLQLLMMKQCKSPQIYQPKHT